MIKLGILFGGRSTEYEVSLMSAYSVITEADASKYDITTVGITREGRWYLYEGSSASIRDGSWCADEGRLEAVTVSLDGSKTLYVPSRGVSIPLDVIFPVLHGKYGEDGTVQGMLALTGIPVIGGGCASNAICMDKSVTKAVAAAAHIPQAKSLSYTDYEIETRPAETVAEIEATLGYPVFIKPANAGSSVGVTKAKTKRELVYGLALASSHDRRAVVEEFIKGAEIEVAITGSDGDITVSVPGEINPGAEFYDYDTKYASDTAEYFIPARISPTAARAVCDYAVRVYNAAGCAGLARADFFVDGENVIFNEINTIPGFTPISMFPKLYCYTENKNYKELIDRLVEVALR